MADLNDTTSEASTSEAPATRPEALVKITLKNGAGEIEVDTDQLPAHVYREVIMQGLKAVAERGMSKITKANIPNEDERKAEIHRKALANVQDMYDGKTKITGQASVKKASGAVMTEAMRLARELVKNAMKAAKIKISHVKASEITAAAKAAIENDPSIIATAEANLKAREETPVKFDIKSLIKVDPELVKKDEAKKAKAKKDKEGQLSAKQAGLAAPRAKGQKGQGAQPNA